MIPVQTKMHEVDNLPGREVEAFIGDPRMVMKSLTDLYSNQALATIREYSTNARDSNVEAGKADVPIRISLPTLMSPYFKVKDSGVGLSATELEKVYIGYGVSTKRESNLTNGMLGFGSKSALTYTNTFTVTAIKDGQKTIAIITRKADYSVVLKTVLTSSTSEPNSVEISVPVSDHYSFTRIAHDYYRFWFPGTVLVDNVEPEQAIGEKIDDNLYYSKNPGTSYVVMGNVAYRIANPAALFTNSRMTDVSFVAFVENGAVEFTPSREDLKYSPETKDTLYKVISNFEKKLVAQAKSEIDGAPNHAAAFHSWLAWTKKLGKSLFGELSFKGDKLEDEFSIQGHSYAIGSRYRYNTGEIDRWRASRMSDVLIVSEFEPELTAGHKAKVRKYLDYARLTGVRIILFTPDPFKNKWVDAARIITWETLKEVTPRAQSKVREPWQAPLRPKGLFDYYTRRGFEVEKNLPSAGNIYYIRVGDTKDKFNATKVLNLNDDDGVVIKLAKNRIDKFTREHPETKDYYEYARSNVELNGISLIDTETRKALGIGTRVISWLNEMDLSKVDDPEFATVKKIVDKRDESLVDYNKAVNIAAAVGRFGEFKRHTIYANDESLLNRYPLLSIMNAGALRYDNRKNDLYIYLNAAYAAAQKGKK